jgi:O-antigen ligase
MLSTENIYIKDIIIWLLFPLIIGLLTLSFIPGWSNVMIVWGIVYVVIYLVYSMYMEYKIQPEVIIFFAWIVWSLTGMFFARDMDIYLSMLIRVAQMGALIFVVAGIISVKKDLSILFAGFAIGGIILALISFLSGEFLLVSNVEAELQAASIAENANVYAYHLLFVIISLLYFLDRVSSNTWRLLFVLLIVLIFLAIVFSGSRQGFVASTLFIVLWFVNCKRKMILQNPKVALTLLLAISVFVFVIIIYVLPQTHLGQRFIDPRKQTDNQRMDLYMDGFSMVQQYPIFGIGLNQYRVHSITNSYSHSYYMEVLTNTGIIGFIIYFSVYVILWRRLLRLKRLLRDPKDTYVIAFITSVIIIIFLVGLTRPLIVSKLTSIFLGGAIGYTWAMERALREEH